MGDRGIGGCGIGRNGVRGWFRRAALVAMVCVGPWPARAEPADLLAQLRPYCGRAFAGTIAADVPPMPDSPFRDRTIVVHLRHCTADTIRMPLHVGDDRSRTWVLRRMADGLALTHDHRHADGTPDRTTLYGGASGAGTPQADRVRFPADARSRALFQAEGRPAAVENVWLLAVEGDRLTYGLDRPGRQFRLVFDLTRPVPTPPPPWGDAAD